MGLFAIYHFDSPLAEARGLPRHCERVAQWPRSLGIVFLSNSPKGKGAGVQPLPELEGFSY